MPIKPLYTQPSQIMSISTHIQIHADAQFQIHSNLLSSSYIFPFGGTARQTPAPWPCVVVPTRHWTIHEDHRNSETPMSRTQRMMI